MNLSVQVAPCAMLVGMFHPFLVYLTPWCSSSFPCFLSSQPGKLPFPLSLPLSSTVFPEDALSYRVFLCPFVSSFELNRQVSAYVSPVRSVPQGHLWFYKGAFCLVSVSWRSLNGCLKGLPCTYPLPLWRVLLSMLTVEFSPMPLLDPSPIASDQNSPGLPELHGAGNT